jgi:hypothetical protein
MLKKKITFFVIHRPSLGFQETSAREYLTGDADQLGTLFTVFFSSYKL